MPARSEFTRTFDALRAMLVRQAPKAHVLRDKPGDYQIASPTLRDRTGRPLFVAGVQIKKSYVTLHLMPLYAVPSLADGLSPALQKRLQGKACFNFTSIEAAQLKELAALMKDGAAAFEKISLPWDSPDKGKGQRAKGKNKVGG